MAHWAEVDENNIVLRVLVGDNDDPNGDEGYQWLINNLGGTWIKASYNTRFGQHVEWGEKEEIGDDGQTYKISGYVPSGKPHVRYNFPGVGYSYDPVRDAFIPPKPFESWILNETTCNWESPIPYPNDGKLYNWNEENTSWEEMIVE